MSDLASRDQCSARMGSDCQMHLFTLCTLAHFFSLLYLFLAARACIVNSKSKKNEERKESKQSLPTSIAASRRKPSEKSIQGLSRNATSERVMCDWTALTYWSIHSWN